MTVQCWYKHTYRYTLQANAHIPAGTILISFSFLCLFVTIHSYTHMYKESESHLRIEYVLDCCAQAHTLILTENSTCIPITNKHHSNRIPMNVLLPCRTRLIIHIRTQLNTNVQMYVPVSFWLLLFYWCYYRSNSRACVCVYLCLLELFCARCCCWLHSSYTKMRNRTKQNKIKNLSNRTLHFPKRFGTTRLQIQSITFV